MRKCVGMLMAAVVVVVCGAGVACAADEMVANPTYVSWSKQKIGTIKTISVTTVMGKTPEPQADDKVEKLEQKQTLARVTDSKVVLRNETGGTESPDTEIAVLATKENVTALGGLGPMPASMKFENVKEGSEKVEVGGKEVETKTWEADVTSVKGGVKHAKVWVSDAVPGRMVKLEFKGENDVAGTKVYATLTMKVESVEEGK